MKQFFAAAAMFFSLWLCVPVTGIGAEEAAQAESIAQLDAEIAKLGALVSARLASLPKDSRVRVGSFGFMGGDSSLGLYWQNELLSVLAGKSGGAYVIQDITLVTPTGRRGYSVSGEVLRLGNTLRIYTRLTDVSASAVIGVWHTDLRVSVFIEEISQSVHRESSSSISSIAVDNYESDSMDDPLTVEINGGWVSRTLHQSDDIDWFIVTATVNTPLVCETSGRLDTRMELYDAESRARLAENDDGGENGNARINWNGEAGKCYIVKVWGYDNSEIGLYGFRVQSE